MAQPAQIILMQVQTMHNKMTAAFAARRCCQHLAFEEAHQCPSTCQRQYGFIAFSNLAGLLKVELVGFHDCFDTGNLGVPDKVLMNIDKQRGINVRLPGDEPVCRKRQHTLWRRHALELFVEFEKTLTRQGGFRLQQLKTRTKINQLNRQLNLLRLCYHALLSHEQPPIFFSLQPDQPTNSTSNNQRRATLPG